MRRIVGRYTARWWVEEYQRRSRAEREWKRARWNGRIGLRIAGGRAGGGGGAVVKRQVAGADAARRTGGSREIWRQPLGDPAAKFGKPKGGWTHRSVLVAVARVGGFLARKHDGLPGWQTIWRGWQRLMWMCEGVEILNEKEKDVGNDKGSRPCLNPVLYHAVKTGVSKNMS